MQLHLLKQQVPESPAVTEGGFVWESPAAAFRPAWAFGPIDARRGEIAALVVISFLLHVLAGYYVARRRGAVATSREQEVMIEVLRPPPPPPPSNLAAPPERQKPPEKPVLAARRAAEPRLVPKLEPAAPLVGKPALNELPALPVGEDPALAMPSGSGVGGGTDVSPSPRETPPPPPAPVRAPPPVVAAHEGANYLKNPRPSYPELALRKGWEGEVLLRVQVDSSGRPCDIAIERSSGRDVLDEAAKEAVRGWAFVPARAGNKPMSGWVTVPIVFHLQ